MKKIVINGRFLVRKLTGQERFAIELLKELDKIVEKDFITLVVPKYCEDDKIPDFHSINVVKYGRVKGHFWEQISFFNFILFRKVISINLCTTCPILKPGITAIHDISQVVHPEFFANSYGKKSKIWHGMMLKAIVKKKNRIITVSNYSKSEIVKYLHVESDRIFVLGNGWDHFDSVVSDKNALAKFGLNKGKYFFAASSIMPQKNFRYIIEIAKRNKNEFFAIAGNQIGLTNFDEIDFIPENVKFLGYVSDGEMKELMSSCKAFIHPAIYEGFAITPLEAISCGAKVLVSNSSCLPEIYGGYAKLIDPYNYDVDLNQVLESYEFNTEELLNKFKWKELAKKFFDFICKISEEK